MKSLVEVASLNRQSHLNHINHPEENVFLLHGFLHTFNVLAHLHNMIINKNEKTSLELSLKIDGSPSIVFGFHPKTKKFFVGTKSVFNKKPKINYTIEDIVANHSHSPGLVEKLNQALHYLPKIMIGRSGIYHGDIIFSEIDKFKFANTISFKPNTITYRVDSNNKEYKYVDLAKFGIAIHTSYKGTPYSNDSLEGMTPSYSLNDIFFNLHDDVYIMKIRTDINEVKNYKDDAVAAKLAQAQNEYKDFNAKDLQNIELHALMLKAYFNYNLRNNKTHDDINNYYMFCNNKLTVDIDKLKTEKGKEKRIAIKSNFLSHIIENTETLTQVISVYHHIQHAKNMLVDALNDMDHTFNHNIMGKNTGPEGYIAVLNNIPVKLVHRHEFSKLNFSNSINV